MEERGRLCSLWLGLEYAVLPGVLRICMIVERSVNQLPTSVAGKGKEGGREGGKEARKEERK
jgi:hypothetical protein